MKKLVFAAIALALTAATLFAQGAPKKVLAQGELDKFLRDLPSVLSDLSAQGVEDFGEDGDEDDYGMDMPTQPYHEILREGLAEAKKSQEVRKVLAKYGWTERFWDYYYTVTVSAYVQMVEGSMTPDVPAQVRSQVKASRDAVHADDHALVARNMERISAAFDSIDEE